MLGPKTIAKDPLLLTPGFIGQFVISSKMEEGVLDEYIARIGKLYGVSPETLEEFKKSSPQKPQEDTYKGVNTYEIDETNVFGAGKNAQKIQTQNQSVSPENTPAPTEDYPIPTDPSLRIIYATCISHTPEEQSLI